MKSILIGYYIGENNSGIDKYISMLIDYLLKEGYTIGLLTSENYADDNFNDCSNIRVHHIPNLKNPLKQFKSICTVLSAYKYDTSYFCISDCSNVIGLIAAYVCKIPRKIVHSHSSSMNGNSIKKKIAYFIHLILKPLIPYLCDVFIACSTEAAKWMFTSKLISKNKIIYLFNFVEIDKFKYDSIIRGNVCRELGIENKITFGQVANFTEVKNHMFSIDVFNEFLKINPNATMLLVGDGPERDKIIKKIDVLNLSSKVKLLGLREDVNRLVQAFDVFLLPSFSEGLPISAIEAQISGVDCFLSDVITRDVKINDECHFLGLNIGSKKWATYINEHITFRMSYNPLNYANYDMKEFYKQIKEILSL